MLNQFTEKKLRGHWVPVRNRSRMAFFLDGSIQSIPFGGCAEVISKRPGGNPKRQISQSHICLRLPLTTIPDIQQS